MEQSFQEQLSKVLITESISRSFNKIALRAMKVSDVLFLGSISLLGYAAGGKEGLKTGLVVASISSFANHFVFNNNRNFLNQFYKSKVNAVEQDWLTIRELPKLNWVAQNAIYNVHLPTQSVSIDILPDDIRRNFKFAARDLGVRMSTVGLIYPVIRNAVHRVLQKIPA